MQYSKFPRISTHWKQTHTFSPTNPSSNRPKLPIRLSRHPLISQLFDILITIVAFDFFPLYDPGFTETEPYSEKFAMFGFDTINFIQDLGTFLNALIALLMIQTLVTMILYKLTNNYLYFLRHLITCFQKLWHSLAIFLMLDIFFFCSAWKYWYSLLFLDFRL